MKPERLFKLAEKEFGGMSGTPRMGSTPDLTPTFLRKESYMSPITIERERAYKKHTHQVHAMLGGRAYPIGHTNQLAMFLMNNILGGGSLNSRLNLSLREAKGLVYTVESTYTPLSDTGYWCIYWACDPHDFAQSKGLVRQELDKLMTQPLSEAALRRSLEQLRGQLAISAQNQENSALALAKSMLYHGSAPLWQETFDKIAQTSAQNLSNVANELFCDENCYILTYI